MTFARRVTSRSAETEIIALARSLVMSTSQIAEPTPINAAITGREATDPTTPPGALSEFYRAFNGRDLALMERNWESSPEAAMDNPLGGIKRGWLEIRQVYQRIFEGAARVEVEFHDYTLHSVGDVFWAIGREHGRFERDGASLDLAIRTTRLYRRDAAGGRWRQVHHHGSIEDPQLLAAYQQAVR
jgi:ketosteroid isomerase-like protein